MSTVVEEKFSSPGKLLQTCLYLLNISVGNTARSHDGNAPLLYCQKPSLSPFLRPETVAQYLENMTLNFEGVQPPLHNIRSRCISGTHFNSL